jgi:hypothetical protein
MTTETILILDDSVDTCIKIDTEDASNLLTIAKDEETGEILESYFNGDEVEVKRDGAVRLKIYYSEKFVDGVASLGCTLISEDSYEFGLVRTLEYVFNYSIVNFSQHISNAENYEAVKARFNIAASDNFGFVFEDGERNIIVQTQEQEVSTDIYVEEVPIQYVDNEANIKPGFLKIKVW